MTTTAQRLKDLAVSDTGFVFDPYSGASFSTNAAGMEILKKLKEDATRTDILKSLHETFDVVNGEDDLERDIDEFVQLLKRNYVVGNDYEVA